MCVGVSLCLGIDVMERSQALQARYGSSPDQAGQLHPTLQHHRAAQRAATLLWVHRNWDLVETVVQSKEGVKAKPLEGAKPSS